MNINSNTPINVDLIKECLEELQPLENKEELLYQKTKERLDIYNKEYLRKFNITVDRLYNYAVDNNVKAMGVLINRLSKMSYGFSKLELSLYKSLCKQDGNKNDRK